MVDLLSRHIWAFLAADDGEAIVAEVVVKRETLGADQTRLALVATALLTGSSLFIGALRAFVCLLIYLAIVACSPLEFRIAATSVPDAQSVVRAYSASGGV